MRAYWIAFGFVAALAAPLVVVPALAHGPQIQLTIDNNKLVTRQLFQDSPYLPLSAPKTAYVMPMADFNGVWHSRPNNAMLAGLPEFPSGPGLAYGYDQLDGGNRTFAAGSVLSVEFTDGLKLWNGSSFVDAGATQLKGFRGSNPAIDTPAANYAVTSDSGPFDSLSLAAVSATYDDDAHASLRWALLGDGISPTSVSPDGVYLVSMQLTSTQGGVAPSDPYYFVLSKNASSDSVAAAVGSLGLAPALVQVVPEPGTFVMLALAGIGFISARRRK